MNPIATYESMIVRIATNIAPVIHIFAEMVVKGFSTSNMVSEDSFNLAKVAETTYVPEFPVSNTFSEKEPFFVKVDEL